MSEEYCIFVSLHMKIAIKFIMATATATLELSYAPAMMRQLTSEASHATPRMETRIIAASSSNKSLAWIWPIFIRRSPTSNVPFH